MCRCADVEKNEKLTIATVLDPRFKDKFFGEQSVKDSVKASVEREIERLPGVVHSSNLVQNLSEQPEPLPKRPCLLTTYSELLEEAGVHV